MSSNRLRNSLIFGAVALAAIGLGIWLWPGSGTTPIGKHGLAWEGRAVASKALPDPASGRLASATPDGRFYMPEVIAQARRLNAPETDGEYDLGILQELFGTVARFSKNGVPEGGNNAEITEQMLGHNKQHLAVLPDDLPCLDAGGQLLDRWGTPYFMHPVSAESIEVRSAGPDRKLWNEDDLISGEEFYEDPAQASN